MNKKLNILATLIPYVVFLSIGATRTQASSSIAELEILTDNFGAETSVSLISESGGAAKPIEFISNPGNCPELKSPWQQSLSPASPLPHSSAFPSVKCGYSTRFDIISFLILVSLLLGVGGCSTVLRRKRQSKLAAQDKVCHI